MAVSTVGAYLSALDKSKLLRLEQFVEAQRLASQSSDAAALAKALARENLISRWQASVLLDRGTRAQLRLGKYLLIEPLGKGGMGTVFLAEHVTMNRRVALKIVPRSVAKDRASLDRFFAEARAIAALDHPNIVRAYSVDNEMDRYFIVMEHVEGQDLQRLVDRNGPLDFASAADYVRQAAEGLAHAHARNLVHCDIKPSNLLVNSQGVIKILDLGLARLDRSDEPRGAAAGELAFGTVDYMAPEQALVTADFDHRADIYSLGCTFYFLLTGHPPFPDGTLAQRIVRHQTQEPRDILIERPDCPPALVEIGKRMMAKEPENRYQSAQEVSAELKRWQDGEGGAAVARVPLLVKPVEDLSPAVAAADDWLSFLGEESPSVASSKGMKTLDSSGTVARRSQSGKQPIAKGKAAFGWAMLGWFDTTNRKILGVVGGIALLAVVTGLASLPFVLGDSKPAPQASKQPKPQDKKALLADDSASPSEKAAAKKPDASEELPGKGSFVTKVELPKQPEHRPDEPPKIAPPKPAEPIQPASKTNLPAEPKPDVKPEVKPAPPAPEKQPEPPPKPVEPARPVSMDGLAAAVDLPPPSKRPNEAVSLGKLDLDPRQALDIQLRGGDSVARGNPRFEAQKDVGGNIQGWSVRMAERNRDAVRVARVWHDDGDWKIQWAAEASDKAALVRYCGLQFSCEKKKHFIALSTPKTVPPLSIDVESGLARTRLSRDALLPDSGLLRFQVQPLDPSLPKYETTVLDPKGHAGRPPRGKSAEPVMGNKVSIRGRIIVTLTKDNTPRVAFIIAFDARGKDALLDVQATCDILGSLPFNLASLQSTAAQCDVFLRMNDTDKNPNKKRMQAQIDAAKTTRDRLKALGDLATELNQKNASIPFCVYVPLGENDDEASPKVVVFQSGEVAKTKPGGAKKNPKGKQPKGRAAPDIDILDAK